MSEEMPTGWATPKIGELCYLVNGKAFKPTDWSDNGLPIIRIQNLNNPNASFNYFDGEVDDKHLVEHGDLLFAWSGTPGTSFGAHVWKGEKAVLNQHIFNVHFNRALLSPDFFRLAINFKLDELIDKAHGGVGLRHVTKGKFEETEVALPPLPEQHRIVAKIDSLFARSSRARDELAHIPKLIERYRQAVLEGAFRGDLTVDWRASHPDAQIEIDAEPGMDGPYALPPSWRWVRLPRLGLLGRGKSRHRPRNDPALFGGPYPFIQTGEVRAADGMLTDFRQTYSEQGLAQSKLWPVGTVCITIAANIAETAVLGIDACFPDSVVGFVANEELCLPEYIEFFIRTVRADLEAFAPATAQKNINLDTLEQVLVPLPPLFEQEMILNSFTAAFGAMAQIVNDYQKSGALIDRLDQSILDKAFSGKLVPQDPADEPASKLLERIQAARAAAPKAKRGRKPKG